MQAAAPDAKKIAEDLRSAFLDRARRDFPEGLQRGWQRELERRTATLPGVALRQSMISSIANGKPKSYRLDTLVRLRNYIGRPLDDILGLEPLVTPEGVVDDQTRRLIAQEVAREVERALTRGKRPSDAPPSARSRVRSK